MPRNLLLPALVQALLSILPGGARAETGEAAGCVPVGAWVDREGRSTSAEAFLDKAAGASVLLLGEQHATPAHHRWQADVVKGLVARGRPVVIGLEQLPKAMQPVLDRWVAGELSAEQFRVESQWDALWGHDLAAYLPLFELARARKIPMVALNVDRAFVRAVGREGFARAAEAGAPIGRPAPPPEAYVASLRAVFMAHARAPDEGAIARFVEAQTVWDRAFAEGLIAAGKRHPGAVAVGIMGLGHVEQGWGAEHQLRALGENSVVSAIPVPPAPPCPVKPGAADALYGAG
ncbi:ChaN family lipoprotein [Thermaurantiacus sp.]